MHVIERYGEIPKRWRSHRTEELSVSIIAVTDLYEGTFGGPDPESTIADFRGFFAGYAILPLIDAIGE